MYFSSLNQDSLTLPSGIMSQHDLPPQPPTRYSQEHRSRSHSRDFEDDNSTTSGSDEPIIELLERERRQWREEREKLIQCIHLQQLELSQRSMAAHERAVDIAKDFARLIGAFEERLVAVETNVQKELSSLKSVAESLLIASGKAPTNVHGTTNL